MDDAAVSSHARADGDLLLSTFATDETPAAISWENSEVIWLIVPARDETNAA